MAGIPTLPSEKHQCNHHAAESAIPLTQLPAAVILRPPKNAPTHHPMSAPDSNPEPLAQRLRSARVAIGLSQQEVADALEVSLSAVRSWEQGRSSPPSSKLRRICRALGVSGDFLIGLTDNAQGLRSGYYIVDQDALERFQHAMRRSDAVDALEAAADYLTFAKAIPGQARLMSHAEYVQILQQLLPVFQRFKFKLPPEVGNDDLEEPAG